MPEQFDSLKEYMAALKERWGKHETIAEKLGKSVATVDALLSGQPSKRSTTREMADHAGIPRQEFLFASGYLPSLEDWEYDRIRYSIELNDDSDLARSLRKFGRILRPDLPLLGGVPCGPADERSQEFLGFLSERFPGHYLLEVDGISMPPFKDKDILVIKPMETPVFDKPNIILIDNESTCKTVEDVKRGKKGGQVYVLSSTNGEFESFEVEVERIKFQGVVVKHLADV